MKNTERIDRDIIDDVRENIGAERGEKSKDDEINNMSPNEILDRWCERNGFINGSETFRRVIGSIYRIGPIDNDTVKSQSDLDDAFDIIEEILRMITSTDTHFKENMHEYICDTLDISSEYLNKIFEIISKMNEKRLK